MSGWVNDGEGAAGRQLNWGRHVIDEYDMNIVLSEAAAAGLCDGEDISIKL